MRDQPLPGHPGLPQADTPIPRGHAIGQIDRQARLLKRLRQSAGEDTIQQTATTQDDVPHPRGLSRLPHPGANARHQGGMEPRSTSLRITLSCQLTHQR